MAKPNKKVIILIDRVGTYGGDDEVKSTFKDKGLDVSFLESYDIDKKYSYGSLTKEKYAELVPKMESSVTSPTHGYDTTALLAGQIEPQYRKNLKFVVVRDYTGGGTYYNVNKAYFNDVIKKAEKDYGEVIAINMSMTGKGDEKKVSFIEKHFKGRTKDTTYLKQEDFHRAFIDSAEENNIFWTVSAGNEDTTVKFFTDPRKKYRGIIAEGTGVTPYTTYNIGKDKQASTFQYPMIASYKTKELTKPEQFAGSSYIAPFVNGAVLNSAFKLLGGVPMNGTQMKKFSSLMFFAVTDEFSKTSDKSNDTLDTIKEHMSNSFNNPILKKAFERQERNMSTFDSNNIQLMEVK